MNVAAGVALIAAGGGLALLLALAAWPRLGTLPALVGVGAAGLVVGAGALLVQREISAAEWVVGLAAVGGLAPVHARLVLGPPGRAR
jgi:hypothetical protein